MIAESLVSRLIPLFDEEAEIVRVPDGTKLIDDDVELQQKTVKKYGVKLCVCGDVTIKDAEPLSSLEYLFVDGTVKIFKGLEDAFSMIESVYDNMKIIDPELGYITDLPAAKIGPMIFKKYPKGVQVEDCGTVSLSKELNAEDIMEKLRIVDCGVVSCTEEQEEAVNMIADDVGIIKVSPQDQEDENNGTVDGMIGVFFGKMKDTQVINAADYKM